MAHPGTYSGRLGALAVRVTADAADLHLAARLLPELAGPEVTQVVTYAIDAAGPGPPLSSLLAPPDPCPARSMAEVVWHAARLAASRLAPGIVGLHGALLETAAGGVVLLGASGAGKSTLAAAAALEGLAPLGDEVALLGPGDGVSALPRPISLAGHSRDLLPGFDRLEAIPIAGRWFVPVPEVSPFPLAAVIDLRRGEATALEALRPARTAVLLCREVLGRTPPTESFRILAGVARRVAGFELVSHDPMAAAALLVETFGRPDTGGGQ